MSTTIRTAMLAMLSAGTFLAGQMAVAADLPKATLKALEKVNFPVDLMAGLDETAGLRL